MSSAPEGTCTVSQNVPSGLTVSIFSQSRRCNSFTSITRPCTFFIYLCMHWMCLIFPNPQKLFVLGLTKSTIFGQKQGRMDHMFVFCHKYVVLVWLPRTVPAYLIQTKLNDNVLNIFKFMAVPSTLQTSHVGTIFQKHFKFNKYV